MKNPLLWIAGFTLGTALGLSWACSAPAAEKDRFVALPSYELNDPYTATLSIFK